jgi:hypothetical protein
VRFLPDQLHKEIVDAASVEDALPALECLLSGGYNVRSDGSLYFIKELVARVNGLSIYIYPKDHPPPHFHIRGGGIDAAFSIRECSLLKGSVDPRHHNLIRWWHLRAQDKLQETWERLSGLPPAA